MTRDTAGQGPSGGFDEWGFESPFAESARSEPPALWPATAARGGPERHSLAWEGADWEGAEHDGAAWYSRVRDLQQVAGEGPWAAEGLVEDLPAGDLLAEDSAARDFAPPEGAAGYSPTEESEAETTEVEGHPGPEGEAFPSGASLQVAVGPTGKGQEHWDPNGTGEPLYSTGPATHGIRLSANFTVKELVTSGGQSAALARISPALVRLLQAIRDRAGRPVQIASGYRSWARNAAVYARRNAEPTLSRHCSGQAADIKVAGLTGLQLAQMAVDAGGPELAIGIGADYIHVDVRGRWTVWTYFGKGSAQDRAALSQLSAHREARRRSPAPAVAAPRDTAPTAAPAAPAAPGRPTTAGQPGGTPGGSLAVPRLPLLRGHAGTPPDLLLRWNAMDRPDTVDVVVHLHGYSGRAQAMQLPRDKAPISGLDFADPAGRAPGGRTRPTLALLPRGHFFGGRQGNGYSFPQLTKPGALDTLVREGLALFARETGIRAGRGRLILTAHSGGGAALTRILAHADPDEVHLFDALYGPADAVAAWARGRIVRELAGPAGVPPALRVLYRPGTAKYSTALEREVRKALAVPGAARLATRFRIERTAVGHNDIPRRYGWLLLADAGAETGAAGAEAAEAGAAQETPEPDSGQYEWDVEAEDGDSEGAETEDEEAGDQESDLEDGQGPRTEGLEDGEPESGEDWPGDSGGVPEGGYAATYGEDESGEGAGYEAQFAPALQLLQLQAEEESPGLLDRLRGSLGFVFGPPLRRGSRGHSVAALQTALCRLCFRVGIDADFGPTTEKALKAFQANAGLQRTGIADGFTRQAVLGALAAAPPIPAAGGLPDAIVRAATGELARWVPGGRALAETDAAATPMLRSYWGAAGRYYTDAQLQSAAWQAGHAWSAAFISWVMCRAGAENTFTYAAAHRVYVRQARRNRDNAETSSPFWAYRIDEVAPEPGDLVCNARGNPPLATWQTLLNPAEWLLHCDVVTSAPANGTITAVGGNVGTPGVGTKRLRVQTDGRLVPGGGRLLVVRCRGRAPGL